MKTTMDEQRGTPLGELEPFLQELGFLAGCEGEFTPSISLTEDGLMIELDGPSAFIFVKITNKEEE